MGKNLFDFGDEKIENEKVDESIKDINQDTREQAKNLYEKYKDYSREDLMQEFLKTSREKMMSGELTPEKLKNTISKISPFLNDNQKEFLKGLIEKIND